MPYEQILIQTVNGLVSGMILALVASGLTLIFGIMGIINLAHGSFYMIGAYMAFTLSSLTGSLTLAIVVGIVVFRGGDDDNNTTTTATTLPTASTVPTGTTIFFMPSLRAE